MTDVTVIDAGTELDIPLDRLKKLPRNARRVPHGANQRVCSCLIAAWASSSPTVMRLSAFRSL